MKSIFRSEDVNFCRIIIPYEFSYEVTQAIGELSSVEFLNNTEDVSPFSRQFTKNIVWCEEVARKIGQIKELIKTENVPLIEVDPDRIILPRPSEFNDLEHNITSFLDQLNLSNKNLADLNDGLNDLSQYLHVLRCIDESILYRRNHENVDYSKNLRIVTGVIDRAKVQRFEQFIWRSSRGNIVFRVFSEDKKVVDCRSNEKVYMAVFSLYLQGDHMVDRIKAICDVFNARIYAIPASIEEKEQTIIGLLTRIKNIEIIHNQSLEQRQILVNQICKSFRTWQISICKIKAIFTTLNMFQFELGSSTLLAECWIPANFVEKVRDTLEHIVTGSAHSAILTVIQTDKEVPTYYASNKLTESFQALVDSYGVATYKEINPGLFMIITFPFLFAVMFGDFGHGFIIVILALYIILQEKELSQYKNHEMFSFIYSGRYIILLMGIFSLYTGLIYNDFFSKSIFLQQSSWILPPKIAIPTQQHTPPNPAFDIITLDPVKNYKNFPYSIGLDPLWMFAKNKLAFINSFKMKLSIILGVSHMLFGMILNALNHKYFHRRLEFYAEFIPQFIFFTFIFGYLVFLIIFKWIFFAASSDHIPSVLITFINMFMNFGKEIPKDERFFHSQELLQGFLVVCAFICIPWMLLVKPIFKYMEIRKRALQRGYSFQDHIENRSEIDIISAVEGHESSESNMGEVAIMQVIHTMEFCMGGISNTASYLRLWALSLAHSQLSELLWTMVLGPVIRIENRILAAVMLTYVFNIFLVFTFLLLVVMEGLSTFLHAIRLHWVEFQSKFYSGQGKPLVVFSLRTVAENNLLIV